MIYFDSLLVKLESISDKSDSFHDVNSTDYDATNHLTTILFWLILMTMFVFLTLWVMFGKSSLHHLIMHLNPSFPLSL